MIEMNVDNVQNSHENTCMLPIDVQMINLNADHVQNAHEHTDRHHDDQIEFRQCPKCT